jgi:hypothetical protein
MFALLTQEENSPVRNEDSPLSFRAGDREVMEMNGGGNPDTFRKFPSPLSTVGSPIQTVGRKQMFNGAATREGLEKLA